MHARAETPAGMVGRSHGPLKVAETVMCGVCLDSDWSGLVSCQPALDFADGAASPAALSSKLQAESLLTELPTTPL